MSNERFDYLEDVKNSVYDFINDEMNTDIMRLEDYAGRRDEFITDFIAEFGEEDSITGFASSSFTMDSETARNNLKGNDELLHEALSERFSDSAEALAQLSNPDMCDVYIRDYVLYEAIDKALSEIEAERNIDLNDEYCFDEPDR